MDIKKHSKNFYHGGHGGKNKKSYQNSVKLRGYILLVVLFFFLPVSFLYAQNSGYFLDTSGGEPLFTQRLSWNGDEYASRYEVIIEKQEGGRYRELRRESARESFIEISLAPGMYRCYVTPYDFLGLPGERSGMDIEVLAARFPELDDSLTEFVYPGKTPVYEMNFSGKDIVPGAEIYLRRLGDAGIAGGEHIIPSEVRIKDDGSEVQLFFDKSHLASGDFELIIRNPGGLETRRGGITVIRSPSAIPPQINMLLTAAWMPLSPLYYEEEKLFPGYRQSASGAAGRFAATFSKWDLFSPGLEIAASWCLVNADSGGQNAVHSMVFGLNLLAQKWFPNEKMAFTYRLGSGYTILSDWQHIHINTGISFLWVFALNLYMETGFDYNHWFTESPFGSGCLRPWAGIGWRF
jgi:hypothetical protein